MRLHKPKTILFIALLFLAVPFLRGHLRTANATNSAFPNTKHGGGTVDSIPFTGVDRGVNPDYGTYYNNIGTEAGQYKPGECTHCHEPHASFGGSEPPPNSSPADAGGGPNQYLGMADASPEFCWYCHENMNLNGNPPGYGYWRFYQGKVNYKSSGHYNNVNMKSPGYGAGSIWPRTDRTGNLLYGHCLNCHTPHGVIEPSATPYDTTAVPVSPTNKHLASNNPGVSTDYMIPRQLIAWEEALCEKCHQSGGVSGAPDVKTDIDKLAGTGSGHPVHDVDQTGGSSNTFSGRHTLKNEASPTSGSWNAYPNSTRHVECYDCHNPHVAQNTTVFQQSGTTILNPDRYTGSAGVYAGGANKGVWGVSVNTSTGAISGRVEDTSLESQPYSSIYLYQVCLKCHSAFADSTLTSNPAPSWSNKARWEGTGSYFGTTQMNLTDVADDFKTTKTGDPYYAYHPVFSIGRNQPPLNANPRWSCVKLGDPGCPWNSNDVPNNRSFGAGTEEVSGRPTGVRDMTIGFANNFVPPWGPASLVTCVDCHESDAESNPRGPHGSSRPFILRKLNTSITYQILNDGNGSAPYTVSYSSFNQGWVSASNNYGLSGVNLATWDPNNLCLNCHRADVYGFLGQHRTSGSPQCGDMVFPRYRQLSRMPHPVDSLCMGMGGGFGYSFARASDVAGAGDPPRGIVCLRCHGGGTVGGIHGNNGRAGYTYGYTWVAPSSNRLLNGTAWSGVTFAARYSSPPANGSCSKNGAATGFNSCTNSNGGNFDYYATYNY